MKNIKVQAAVAADWLLLVQSGLEFRRNADSGRQPAFSLGFTSSLIRSVWLERIPAVQAAFARVFPSLRLSPLLYFFLPPVPCPCRAACGMWALPVDVIFQH